MPNPNARNSYFIAALKRCELPAEAKRSLDRDVTDPPPHPRTLTIADALRNNEIPPGASNERTFQKALRVALWALLYFPNQYIPNDVFNFWAYGRKHSKEELDKFSRNSQRIKDLLERTYGDHIPNVGYTTQKAKIDIRNTVDGFRLTYNADDYICKIVEPLKKKLLGTIIRTNDSLRESRLPMDSIKSEELQGNIAETKTSIKELMGSDILNHLLPAPKKKV